MEKTVIEQVQTDKITHSFYCDECGEHLGDSVEYDDGWFEEFGEFEESCCIQGKWYSVKKHLCEEHKKQLERKIEAALLGLGFKQEQ